MEKEDFSPSLTPPISPYIEESLSELSHSKPPLFCCVSDHSRDGGRLFSPDGYIGRGSLKRLLLRLDPSPTDYETDTVDLFGFPWVTETALVESTKLLFGLFRQQLHRLENLIQSSSHDFGQASSVHFEAEEIRKHCVTFLLYVKVFISRYLEPSRGMDNGTVHPYEKLEAELPSVLLGELHATVLYIGKLQDLPSNIHGAFSIQNQGKLLPPSWHLLHLHLDIHWSILEILHLLGEKMLGQVVYAHQFMNQTGENLTNISLFEEHCTHLLCDLVGFAINKYTKVRPTDALTSCHYLCDCTKELWVMIIHLLDHRSKASHTEFFWSYVNKLLRILLEGTHVDKTRQHFTAHCKDPLGFSWWLVTHLAELYQYSRNGAVEGKKVEDNWSFVEELLKRSCDNQGGVLEEQLRMHLQCCLTLCRLWDSNVKTVTSLWEYYSKNLNNAFTIPWLGLKGLMSVSKTPFSMLELVKSCCSEQQSPDLYRMANSFQIFLRIVALQMNKETTGTHPWKQIKGRVYSKFHQRKMQELSEAGLMNFLSLFLVLAATAEVEDVVSRVSDLLGLLNPSSISTTQKALIWRGLFAFILLYEEKGLDIGVLADQLSVAFQQAAKEFYLKTTDNTRKLTLWTLLSTYIEGVQEVFETSSYLHLSEEKLLNEGFVMLLPACRESELHTALGFLQTVLARLRSVYKRSSQSLQQSHTAAAQKAPSPFVAKERHLAIAGALWRNFFHFLKSLRLSQTPPPQLADTAAGFSLLAVDMPSTAPSDLQPQPLLSIMQNFGWDEMLNPQLVSRYLSHLIQNSALVASLSGVGSSSYQALSVRSWFRCVLQHHINVTPNADQTDIGRVAGKGNADQLSELTRLVFKLPEMEMLLLKAQIEQSAVKVEPRPALSLFIKAVGRAYAGLQTLAEKSAMVSKALEYAGDILKYIKPYLVNKGPPEGLQLSYWTVGCLVKHWALILATSKAQQLLFRIIDCLLLPHALFQQDKGIPSPMLSVLRDNLPLFLQGLSVISTVSQTQGAYLKQQLRNIIQQYFGRFLPASPSLSAIVNHPILLALCESSSSPRTAQLRRTVLQVITDGYMQFKGHAPPPRLASILSFLHEVLRRSDDSDLTSYTEPLPAVLKCLVLVNEPQVKRLSTETLQLVVEHCQAVARGGPCTQLSSVLRQFVEEHMGVYDLQVYNVLEIVAVLEQSIVIGLIPTTSRCLRDTEHKRGLGKNTSQRNAYKRLLSHLADEGQAEILNLDNE
ncbi:protein MMS22-like [Acipenser ruthenus]|uniref:protein MMS22-like n=1 Tax=Acipenser ruthenus TaxID=7906 RepID=UPI0027425EA2|nr:protein MMS22-like [Acipenser ruthenus]